MSGAVIPPSAAAEVALAQAAANDCAHVLKAFTHIRVEDLFKSTRGAAAEAFPRQLLMAGLVSELGFSSLTVGRAVGRDKATVEHACRIIEAIRGGIEADDLAEILGDVGVAEFLGGHAGAAEFLESAEALIDDLFAAFRCVAVKGRAYRGEVERLRAVAQGRAM